jgi:hypothetical protein
MSTSQGCACDSTCSVHAGEVAPATYRLVQSLVPDDGFDDDEDPDVDDGVDDGVAAGVLEGLEVLDELSLEVAGAADGVVVLDGVPEDVPEPRLSVL